MLNNNYNTVVKTGGSGNLSAETKALGLLRQAGFEYLQQIDWIGRDDKNNWTIFEVKAKELFTPGKNFPHYGAGLNKAQLYLRTKLLEELGLRTYLIVFVQGTNAVYGAFLDELEKKGNFYDTPNGIRIYPIYKFKAINNAPGQNLGGSL